MLYNRGVHTSALTQTLTQLLLWCFKALNTRNLTDVKQKTAWENSTSSVLLTETHTGVILEPNQPKDSTDLKTCNIFSPSARDFVIFAQINILSDSLQGLAGCWLYLTARRFTLVVADVSTLCRCPWVFEKTDIFFINQNKQKCTHLPATGRGAPCLHVPEEENSIPEMRQITER